MAKRKIVLSIQSKGNIEIEQVTNLGKDVFGTLAKFKLWLETPNFALGNIKPIEIITNSNGREKLINELTRINHGILL